MPDYRHRAINPDGFACSVAHGIAMTEPRSVFARNIPYDASYSDVERFFCRAGNAFNLDVPRNNKRCKGYATVEFESAERAIHAVKVLNGAKLRGREIEVRLDRVTGTVDSWHHDGIIVNGANPGRPL